MINQVTLEARLVNDPELRHVGAKNAKTVTTSLACNFWNGTKENVVYIKVVLWNKKAEAFCNYLHKGSKVIVSGKLINNNYTDKTGVKRSEIQIQVDDLSFDTQKKQDSGYNQYNHQVDNNVEEPDFPQEDTSDLAFY